MHVICTHRLLACELAQHAQCCSKRLLDWHRLEIGKHRGDFFFIGIRPGRSGGVRADTECDPLIFEMDAAISSRSATDHRDGPRIA
jgi:hypothetical protein